MMIQQLTQLDAQLNIMIVVVLMNIKIGLGYLYL
jgi:hypothetical protein